MCSDIALSQCVKRDGIQASKTTIYWDIVRAFESTLKFGYENNNYFNQKSYVVSLGYTRMQSDVLGSRTGFLGDIQFRKYLKLLSDSNHIYLEGIYLAGVFQYRYQERSDRNVTVGGTYNTSAYLNSITIAALMGYKFIMKKFLVVDFYFGGGYRYSDVLGEPNLFWFPWIFSQNYTGIAPKFGMQIGICF